MATSLQIRNIDRLRPVPDCTCFICGASAKLLRSMQHPISGKWTAGCETCYQRATAPQKPEIPVSPIDTDECVTARLEGFIAGWRVWEAVHLPGFMALSYLALPAGPIAESRPVPTAASWEDIVDMVLDGGAVISNLDFAIPVDRHTLAVPAKVLDITARIQSRAAWSDEATKQARRCAGQLSALYQNRYDWKTGIITPRKEIKLVQKAAA